MTTDALEQYSPNMENASAAVQGRVQHRYQPSASTQSGDKTAGG
jgi:hypothetical protein